jgi:hypothetical protein
MTFVVKIVLINSERRIIDMETLDYEYDNDTCEKCGNEVCHSCGVCHSCEDNESNVDRKETNNG